MQSIYDSKRFLRWHFMAIYLYISVGELHILKCTFFFLHFENFLTLRILKNI
jgi:hypothetical protein